MGGHTLNTDGIVLDMEFVNHLSFDKEQNVVRVGSGAHWSDVLTYLNEFGKAPRTLQQQPTPPQQHSQ